MSIVSGQSIERVVHGMDESVYCTYEEMEYEKRFDGVKRCCGIPEASSPYKVVLSFPNILPTPLPYHFQIVQPKTKTLSTVSETFSNFPSLVIKEN